METKIHDNMEEYPVFTRDDCPNGLARWLDQRQKKRDNEIMEQIHDYHMDMLSVKQKVIDNRMYVRLGGVAILILMVLFLTAC